MSFACRTLPFRRMTPQFFQGVNSRPAFLEFFAGSGLVGYALQPFFQAVWANDICPRKAAVFTANHQGIHFDLGSVAKVCGASLPNAFMAWASFPCQDLSLAGKMKGIRAKRSGLVWEWLRVVDEMPSRPCLLALENVVGLVSTDNGAHYRELHQALIERGYNVGAMLLDAVRWLPQSRPRIFIVAVDASLSIPEHFKSNAPNWLHPFAIQKVAASLEHWIWWYMPEPPSRTIGLSDIVDFSLPCHNETISQKNIAMIPVEHRRRLEECGLSVAPGYKRIREGKQVLELRFDDVAGCLRTPSGGSSRQYLVLRYGETWRTRILSPREAARLMGAPDFYELPGTFNDGYRAMGDAVAAPVAGYLAEHLLAPLAAVYYGDA